MTDKNDKKKPETKEKTDKTQAEAKKAPLTPLQCTEFSIISNPLALKNDLFVIEKAVENKDYFYISRILKKARSYKKRLNSYQLSLVWNTLYGSGPNFSAFSDYKESTTETFDIPKERAAKLAGLREVELYVQTILLIHLVKQKSYQQVFFGETQFKFLG